jgi:Uma2 family endonuclease
VESIEEYVLVSQDRPRVETFTRQKGGTWLFDAAADLAATVRLHVLGIDLPLAEIYAGVEFPPAEPPPELPPHKP